MIEIKLSSLIPCFNSFNSRYARTRLIINRLHRKFYSTFPSQINWIPKSKSKAINMDTVKEGLSAYEIRWIKSQSKLFGINLVDIQGIPLIL